MNKVYLTLLLIAPHVLTAGCATAPAITEAESAAPPSQVWRVQLNARAGAAHNAPFTLTGGVEDDALGLEAEGSPCFTAGRGVVERAGSGGKVRFVDGGNELEFELTEGEGMLFGRYRFSAGKCRGDWGSLVGTHSSGSE